MDRREFQPEQAGETARFLIDKRHPEKGDARDRCDAGIAIGKIHPIDQDNADDFAKGQRDNGQIVAAQPQHGKTEDNAPESRQYTGQRQADPERQSEFGRQQGIGICPHRIKRDIAKIKQARQANHNVEAPAKHDIDQYLHAVIVDPFQRALRAKPPKHGEGENKQGENPDNSDRLRQHPRRCRVGPRHAHGSDFFRPGIQDKVGQAHGKHRCAGHQQP